MVKKDIEIQPGFELGSSEFRSDALSSNWSSGIGAEVMMAFIYRHSFVLRLDLS